MELPVASVASHLGNKYLDLMPGLYVQVPSSDSKKVVVYKAPWIPIEKLDHPTLMKLMKETLSPMEWFDDFWFCLIWKGRIKALTTKNWVLVARV